MIRALAFITLAIILSCCKESPEGCDHLFLTATSADAGDSKLYYDSNGKVTTISGEYGWTEFSYDDNGHLNQVISGWNGELNQFVTRYHFNSLGQFVSTSGPGIDSLVLTYDQHGRVSRIDTHDSDGDIRMYKIYTYTDENKVKIDAYNALFGDDKLKSQMEYIFDDKNLPYPDEVYYAAYRLGNTVMEGNIVSTTEFVMYGSSVGTVTSTAQLEYNSAGYPLVDAATKYTYDCEAPRKP